MITIQPHARGSILPIRAKPGAKANAVVGEHDGALRVAVSAPAEDGRANEAIVALLAETLGLKKAQVELVSGASSRSKRFLIAGVDPDDLLDRIDAALTPTLFDPIDPEL